MAKYEVEIFNNFVTPLVGTFLKLPESPCIVHCPSCGITDESKVEMEMHRTSYFDFILGRLIYCCCCCCKEPDLKIPFRSPKANHYCKNCSCYFGQHQIVTKLLVHKKRAV